MDLEGVNWDLVLQILIGGATAAATVALVIFTRVLAKETRRLSDATNQPFVVATLEPNPWSMMHIDLRLENTGNAPAFDVRVAVEPPVAQPEPSSKGGMGMDSVDILRPNQSINSFVAEGDTVLDTVYDVECRWKRHPHAIEDETISYQIDMRKWGKLSRLGAITPNHQIAQELKKLRDDWQAVARGQRKLEINTHSQRDRERETDRRQRAVRTPKADKEGKV